MASQRRVLNTNYRPIRYPVGPTLERFTFTKMANCATLIIVTTVIRLSGPDTLALGRHEGFEPSTSGTTIRRSTKLS